MHLAEVGPLRTHSVNTIAWEYGGVPQGDGVRSEQLLRRGGTVVCHRETGYVQKSYLEEGVPCSFTRLVNTEGARCRETEHVQTSYLRKEIFMLLHTPSQYWGRWGTVRIHVRNIEVVKNGSPC